MHRFRLVVPALALGLVAAACSSGGGATTAPSTAPTTAPTVAPASEAPVSEAPASAPVAGGATINLAETSLGTVLVDGTGLTLYIFTADADGASACYEDCAAAWPPLVGLGDPTLGEGVDATKVGSIARTDGTTQVTYAGMPLYTYAADTAAGQTNGQGVGEKWYVIDAAGTVIK